MPKDGWVYRDPFRDSIVDDYISKRGIIHLVREGGLDPSLDVNDVADLAKRGDVRARIVFQRFGDRLGDMLNRYIQVFQPNAVVIGGQIAKSHDLFVDQLRQTLADGRVHIEFSDDTSRSTFVGVARLLQQT